MIFLQNNYNLPIPTMLRLGGRHIDNMFPFWVHPQFHKKYFMIDRGYKELGSLRLGDLVIWGLGAWELGVPGSQKIVIVHYQNFCYQNWFDGAHVLNIFTKMWNFVLSWNQSDRLKKCKKFWTICSAYIPNLNAKTLTITFTLTVKMTVCATQDGILHVQSNV